MDYIIGFLLGIFLKDTYNFIKRVSEYDWNNRTVYKEEWDWLSHEDLP